MIPQKYAKEMPGAETDFRPADQADYAGHPWDIRISIGNGPLDEAYFFTMDTYADAERSIRELLEDYALNPAHENELDTDDYPELPFLQQELIQCYSAAKEGRVDLAVWVNHWPERVDLDVKAVDFLSACTFRDRSWDYLVLDLVFEVNPTTPDEAERQRFCERYADLEPTEAVLEEARLLAATYAKYASVSVAPCALGVPEGFDVRLQMMEYDGLDPERCAVLHFLLEEELAPADACERVIEALMFKTNFTAEILEGLRTCGKVFEDA